MVLQKIVTYKELEKYLKEWINFSGDVVNYDVLGVFSLISSLLENLSNHEGEVDFNEFKGFFSDEEIEIINKLINMN